MNSLHFALHTEVHSLCDFSESTKSQHHTRLKSLSLLMISLHFAQHTEAHSLCDFSEIIKITAPHTPGIILRNSLQFVLRTEVNSLYDFSESAKIPAPHTPEILYFQYEFTSFYPPYWGLLIVWFQWTRQNPSTAHTRLKSFIFFMNSLYVLSTRRYTLCVISANPQNFKHRAHLESFIPLWIPYVLLSIPRSTLCVISVNL